MATIAILVVAAVAALAYLPMSHRAPGASRSVVKTLPLAGLALVTVLEGGPWLLTGALVLSALGDLALSRSGARAFLAGLAAFALAHLCYVALFAASANGWPGGALLVLGVLALSTEAWLAPHTGGLRWPVRGYVVVICAMGGVAAALPGGLALAGAGAALFILSDLVLAVQLFRMPAAGVATRAAGWLLWGLYVGGQGLIVLAFVPVAALS